ncbi:MAG: hypothetical protein ABSA16_10940 [Thermoguttaceae bacterium]|jgi:hypothetical protein
METRAEVIGLYPFDAPEPCHLIEILVHNSQKVFDIGKFTQELTGRSRSDWQVPYGEKIVDLSGSRIIADPWMSDDKKPEWWSNDVRIAFFFHYLDISLPLITPFGKIDLPQPRDFPNRLSFMNYDPPG